MAIASNLDSLTALRAFVAAADARSFKAAGAALGMTSSAVGKAIARLEQQLGSTLLHRTTRTITLTEAGSLFLVRARRVLAELEAAEDEVAQATSAPRGRLRVSLPLGGQILTCGMAQFMALHPQILLELDYSDRLVDVVDEGYDVVIRTGDLTDSRLLHRRLGSFDWLLAAAPAYLAVHGEPATPAELAHHVCLRQKFSSGRIAAWPFRSAPEAEVPVSLTATIIEPLVDIAVAGGGVAAFPRFLVRDRLADGSLQTVLEGELQVRGAYNMLWPASRYRVPKVRVFVDFFSEWMPPRIAS